MIDLLKNRHKVQSSDVVRAVEVDGARLERILKAGKLTLEVRRDIAGLLKSMSDGMALVVLGCLAEQLEKLAP